MVNITSASTPRGVAGEAFLVVARVASMMLVVVLPLIVNPWGVDGYNAIKSLIVYALALTAVMGWATAYALVRRPGWIPTVTETALWLYLLAVLLSTVVSVNPYASFFGAPRRFEGLFMIGAYAALYFVGMHIFGSEHAFRSLTRAACGAAALTVGYGLLQLVLPPAFAGEAFIRDWYRGAGMLRISSTLGNPVVFGGYLGTLLPLLVALGMISQGRSRKAWLAAAAVTISAIALTFTRAAWLAAAGGIVVFALLVGRRGWRSNREVAGIVLAAVAAAAVVVVTAGTTPSQVGARVAASVDRGSGSVAQRLYIWDRTLHVIRQRPWLGWGLETLREVFPYDRASMVPLFGQTPVIIDKAHNDLLQVAVSVGIPGAAAYAGFWALIVVSVLRLWRRAGGPGRIVAAAGTAGLIAYLIQVQFSFSAVALAPIVWLLAGALCGWEARGAGGTE